MITFKTIIRKNRPRPDKTWIVYIRVTYNRDSRYINTGLVVSKRDMTSTFKIKNQQVLDACEDIIREYRRRAYSLGLDLQDRPIDEIIALLRMKSNAKDLSYSDFYVEWLEKAPMKDKGSYRAALNNLKSFFGKDNLLFSDITNNSINKWLADLSQKKRAPSLYFIPMRKVFNEGRKFYNDEDNDVYLIKHTLSKVVAPKQNVAEKRALSADTIRKIFELPYEEEPKNAKYLSNYNLALDCFRMSFCLLGTNAIDFYTATEYDGTTLCYNRQKTKDRRSDKARMEIVVPDIIKPLMDKYRGKKYVFWFQEHFSSHRTFENAITLGLRKIAPKVGEEKITFYAARHSMATIAVNDACIDKWTVNDMLCHLDPSLRVTELYIKKSFKPINEANAKLLEYMFGNSEKKE